MTKKKNFAWHHLDMHITQVTPLENGNYKGGGRDHQLKLENYHKKSYFPMLSKSHVLCILYITQFNPFKNEDYEDKGIISWLGILQQKFKHSH